MDKSSLSAQTCPKCFFLNPADAAHCGRCGAELGRSADKGFLPEQVIGGRYRLVRRIGEGGMGEVWEAVQTGVNLSVAIKFLHPVLMIHNTARQRVLKEAEALGRLRRSSRIITLYDYFETDETVALVLEFAEGGSLADRIDTEGTIPWSQAVSWMDGVLRGLGAIHREGLIHRDMKPDNVLLGRDEDGDLVPKVTDLGIAHNQEGTRITRDGSQLGTFEYMAPELFQAQEPSIQSDLYACGVMFYELLVGEAPFTGTQATVMLGHVSTPPDMARLPHDVPTHVRHALDKALAKDPAERFADCNAFRAALSGEGTIASSVAPARRHRGGRRIETRARGGACATPDRTPASTASAAQVEPPAPRQAIRGETSLWAWSSAFWHWAASASLCRVARTSRARMLTRKRRHCAMPQHPAISSPRADDNTIRLWNASDGRLLRTLKSHTADVNSVTFAPDSQTIASGSGYTIRLWNTIDGRHLRTLEGHTGLVYSVNFSPDGQTIASGSYDNAIRLWSASDGRHLRTLNGHTADVNSVTFAPDGQTIASGSWDTTIRLWNASDGRHLRTLEGHTSL